MGCCYDNNDVEGKIPSRDNDNQTLLLGISKQTKNKKTNLRELNMAETSISVCSVAWLYQGGLKHAIPQRSTASELWGWVEGLRLKEGESEGETGRERRREKDVYGYNFLVFLDEKSNKSQLAPSYYWKRGSGKGRLLDESVSQK